jgi:uncharacterized membrane protein
MAVEVMVVVVAYRLLVVADIEEMVFVIVVVEVLELNWAKDHESHVYHVFDFSTTVEFCHMPH